MISRFAPDASASNDLYVSARAREYARRMLKKTHLLAALLLAPMLTSVALAHPGYGPHIHPEDVRSVVMTAVGVLASIGLAGWIKILRDEAPARKSRRR